MNLEKLKPWNWFRHEESAKDGDVQIPVTKSAVPERGPDSGAQALWKLHREMDQLFNNVFAGFGMPALRSSPWPSSVLDNAFGAGFMPQTDVCGDERQYEITLDVPGLSEDALSIELDGEVLRIRGEIEEKSESNEKHYYRAERRYGSFQRTLSLPDDADAEAISASLSAGVLRLTMPRRQLPQRDVKKIPISH